MYNAETLIPRLQPQVKRSVTRDDALPSPIGNHSSATLCRICQNHEARYACPRCEVPYCSVDCYKRHDGGGGSCTEGFYQERVSSVLGLEAKDASQSMESILNRSHQMYSETSVQDNISEDELYRLAEALEHSNMDDKQLVENALTPELRLAFERAVRKGELSHVVESWHPWWVPELIPVDETIDTPTQKLLSLDERLLAIPSFRSLRVSASPCLSFNLLELLFSIATTLRLYHGVDNAIAHACPDVAYTLVALSAVLREDARYNSVAEALVSCITGTSFHQLLGNHDFQWNTVVEDVALLCDNLGRRFLGRAFLEAIDITKAVIKSVKKRGEDATELRKARKKLEFYLSWTQEAELPQDLARKVRDWMHEWKQSSEVGGIDMVRLPSNSNHSCGTANALPNASRKIEEPHLVEVKSTRKNCG